MIFPLCLIKYIHMRMWRNRKIDVRKMKLAMEFVVVFPLSTTIIHYYSIFCYNVNGSNVSYIFNSRLFRKILRIKSNSHPIDWTPHSMNRTCFTYVRKWRCCTWVTSTNRKEEKKNHIYLNIPQNLSNKKI